MDIDLKHRHGLVVKDMWANAAFIDPAYVHNDSLLPYGKIEGRDAYLAAGRIMKDAFPDMTSVAEEVIVADQTTAARWRWTGTHMNEFHGIAATQNLVSFLGMTMYHWRDGLAYEGWTLFEYTHFYAQLGVKK